MHITVLLLCCILLCLIPSAISVSRRIHIKNARPVCVHVVSPKSQSYYSGRLIQYTGIGIILCTCCVFVDEDPTRKIDTSRLAKSIPPGRYLVVFNENEMFRVRSSDSTVRLKINNPPNVEPIAHMNMNGFQFLKTLTTRVLG